MTILADELLLLAYHDQTGRNQASHLELGLAGAILLDLAMAEHIDINDKRVHAVAGHRGTGDPLLDEMLQRIQTDKPRKAQAWVQRIARGLAVRIRDRMVAAGALEHVRDTVLVFFPFNRYRPGMGARIEADAMRRLTGAVDAGRTEDARTGALASLVYILQMEKAVFPDRKRRDVRAALKTLSEGSWASTATKRAVESARAAAMAAITASIAASTAASSSS